MKKTISSLFIPKELSVVSLMTPSLNTILNEYKPSQIKEIIAKARTTESMNDSYIEQIGAKFFEKKEHNLFLHFSCIPPNSKNNPLTNTTINSLKKEMSKWGIEDATVDKLKVTLNLKNVKSLIKRYEIDKKEILHKFLKETDTDFLATFYQETKLEPEVRDELEKRNEDLFNRLKFHRSLLICRKLIPEALVYSIREEQIPHLIDLGKGWKEDYAQAIFSPQMIAQQISTQLNPYGYVRYYKETSANVLELVRGE